MTLTEAAFPNTISTGEKEARWSEWRENREALGYPVSWGLLVLAA